MTDTALVLGGGGLTGIGWEIGILHGLAREGVDLTGADLIVGTSAGSVVGTQIASGVLGTEEMYERQLPPPQDETVASMGAGLTARYLWQVLRARDADGFGRRMGRLALSARVGEESVRREVIAGRLLTHEWPERRLVVTAVDAATGRLRTFDRDSGVDLVSAVGASCAVPGVWPPVTIGAERYIDGGVRSPVNADLAAGCSRVVVIAPLTRSGGPVPSLREQVGRLVAAGAQVAVVTPDDAARKAFGRNVLDPRRRAGAARAGLAQAAARADAVRKVWG
ncbi:patatin-like phospholipase family protein [Streptomyces sp. NPDC060194]|uniref:patatin-like phospholipase family protein n=1 Tax=Streptomyces sp. NPDC060194 TaxID=3347069 RepID=UPI00365B4636